MDIIIFGGQSNMQGQSEALLGALPISNCYEYKYLTDTLIPLKNPVGEDITYEREKGYPFEAGVDQGEWLKAHILGSACYGNTSLVPAFCKAYWEQTKREAVAVHTAKGSTIIADWLPESAGYQMLLEKARAALAKVGMRGERRFFVWLQGESDAVNGVGKEEYKEKIAVLSNALKRDLGIEKFGIIRIGRFTKDERDLEIIGAQDEICRENEGFLMLSTLATELNQSPEFMNPYVGGHYSAKGLEKLGRDAGETLGQWVRKSKSKIDAYPK